MPWIALYVGIAVIGLAVLFAFTLRLWRQVRDFGRTVSAAGQRIADVTDEMAKVSSPNR